MTQRIALAVILGAAAACGQTFEVASVRQNRLDDRIVTINVGPGGSFTARGYTLVLLMQRAYAVMDWNVEGGPDWIRVDRFDVAAKANVAGNLTEAQLRPMLAKLLEERFRLELHRTSKPMAGYALQVARGGPKLTRSAEREEQRDSFRLTASRLSGHAISMRDFARFVGGKLGVIPADETGLDGLYDFDIEWKPESNLLPDVDPREAQRAAVFDALEKQLGLKFVAKKIAVEILAIDHAERPSEN